MIIPYLRVEQMTSPTSYRPIANQFTIHTEKGVYFQSYSTIIAYIPQGEHCQHQTEEENKIKLDKHSWDYSRTTAKYRNKFLGQDTKEVKRKIKEGIYILVDLNKAE